MDKLRIHLYKNTTIPLDIINIIINYAETTMDIVFENKTLNISQKEYNNLDDESYLNMKLIRIYGTLILIDPEHMFNNSKIQNIIGSVKLIGNTSFMFAIAKNFNCNINHWDVSEVTNMYAMFYNVHKFNQNMCKWDVSNVNTMSYMFYNASNFNGDISFWDVSNVNNMSYMFASTLNFNCNISNWNVKNLKNMIGMFSESVKFNQNINNWDVSNVTDMSYIFLNAYSFNQNIDWCKQYVINSDNIFKKYMRCVIL
jgi:surface protein